MNKLLIGLLVIGAAAGVYFYMNSQEKKQVTTIQKELIVGNWKYDVPNDSLDRQHRFMDNGIVVTSINDSTAADTTHYSWSKKDEFLWKKTTTDSIPAVFSVVLLTKDSLELRSADSISLVFKRAE